MVSFWFIVVVVVVHDTSWDFFFHLSHYCLDSSGSGSSSSEIFWACTYFNEIKKEKEEEMQWQWCCRNVEGNERASREIKKKKWKTEKRVLNKRWTKIKKAILCAHTCVNSRMDMSMIAFDFESYSQQRVSSWVRVRRRRRKSSFNPFIINNNFIINCIIIESRSSV